MIAALLLQVSSLVHPLYLDEKPPELRAVRHVMLVHAGAKDVAPSYTRTKEDTVAMAKDLVARLRAGGDFGAAVRDLSQAPDAQSGGVLGSFAPGMLGGDVDRFLFAAELGAVSDPIPLPSGVHVFQRVEALAAVLEIRVAPDSDDAKKRIEFVHQQIVEGADFAAMAREQSSDRETAARGGQFAIFERGPRDLMLKAAAFELAVGHTSPPIHTPLGWHVLKRVPLESVSPDLREKNWARLSAILVQHDHADGADKATARTQEAAKRIADAFIARLEKGEDFAKLARDVNDDRGGKERAGDLGWVYRFTPDLPRSVGAGFGMKPGESELYDSSLGYVIVKRVR